MEFFTLNALPIELAAVACLPVYVAWLLSPASSKLRRVVSALGILFTLPSLLAFWDRTAPPAPASLRIAYLLYLAVLVIEATLCAIRRKMVTKVILSNQR